MNNMPKSVRYFLGIICILGTIYGLLFSNGKVDNYENSKIGVGQNIIELHFTSTESADTREHIIGFLETYNIKYRNIVYDTENKAYVVSVNIYCGTQENVEEEFSRIGTELEQYNMNMGTNDGITQLGCEYRSVIL